MASKSIQLCSALLGISVIGGILYGILYGIYAAASAIIDKLDSVDSDLSKALVAGSFTLFAAIAVHVIGKIWEQRMKQRQEVYAKKIPVYEKHVTTLFNVIFAEKRGLEFDNVATVKSLTEITEKLMFWGSPEVIKTWQTFRDHDFEKSSEKNSLDGFGKFAELMLAIRKDVGNSNSGLKKADVLSLFINDYEAEVAKTQVTGKAEGEG